MWPWRAAPALLNCSDCFLRGNSGLRQAWYVPVQALVAAAAIIASTACQAHRPYPIAALAAARGRRNVQPVRDKYVLVLCAQNSTKMRVLQMLPKMEGMSLLSVFPSCLIFLFLLFLKRFAVQCYP